MQDRPSKPKLFSRLSTEVANKSKYDYGLVQKKY